MGMLVGISDRQVDQDVYFGRTMMYEDLDFSKKSFAQIIDHLTGLSGESGRLATDYLGRNGIIHLETQAAESDLPLLQEVAVRVEIWNRFGLTLYGQSFGESSNFMSERFGSDWEKLLANPRSSKMSGTTVDKVAVAGNKAISAGNKALIPDDELDLDSQLAIVMKMKATQITTRQIDCGSPVLSIRPIGTGKNPCLKTVIKSVEVTRNGQTFMEDREMEVEAHSPLEGNIECGVLHSKIYLAPVVRSVECESGNAGAFSDITGGGKSRRLFITGFVEVEKFHRCGGVGHILMEDGSVRDLSDEMTLLQHYLTSIALKGGGADAERQIYSTWLNGCSLSTYYRSKGLDGAKSALKAYTGGTLKLAWVPSLDRNKITLRAENFHRDAVDRKILEIAGLAGKISWLDVKLANVDPEEVAKSDQRAGREADPNRFKLPEIPDYVRLEYEGEALRLLGRSFAARTLRDNTAIQNPTHGRLRSKQSKMRVKDNSTSVNGPRCYTLPNGFVKMKLMLGDQIFWQGVTNREDLLKRMEEFAVESGEMFRMDWAEYAADRVADGSFKPGIGKGMLSTKDGRERLAEVLIGRMIQFSLEDGLSGLGQWVELDGRYFAGSELCSVWFSAAESDSQIVSDLISAVQLITDAGESVTSKTVLSAYRKPGPWRMLAQETKLSASQ